MKSLGAVYIPPFLFRTKTREGTPHTDTVSQLRTRHKGLHGRGHGRP